MNDSTNAPSLVNGTLRGLGAATGGGMVAGSENDLVQLIGAIITALSIAWSIYEKVSARRRDPGLNPPPPGYGGQPPSALLVLLLGALLLAFSLPLTADSFAIPAPCSALHDPSPCSLLTAPRSQTHTQIDIPVIIIRTVRLAEWQPAPMPPGTQTDLVELDGVLWVIEWLPLPPLPPSAS
jgi:hypothetical protein